MTDAVSIRPVGDGEWPVVGWLWQLFRYDLALVVDGFPYADGRYRTAELDRFPSADGIGHLAVRPHPNTGEEAPVGFALVDGLAGDRRSIAGFWVAPQLRRTGVGTRLALTAIGSRPGPWTIGFQHDNPAAGSFWRTVADAAFGSGRWTEIEQAVPGRPHVPPDHLIRSDGPTGQSSSARR